jgi:pimeloyl-ACP methyl ester carboxylesterase
VAVTETDISTRTPAWFTEALAIEAECGVADVRGVSVHYRAWGEPGRRGIVLVHGGAAHSRWWDHIAPLLDSHRRVVALDLSGHGDSDRRGGYDLNDWAEEVLAVATAAGITGPPLLIGHSMGGMVTLMAARLFGEQLAGSIAIDSPVRDLTPEELAARERNAFGPLRVYPSREGATSRFRTVPDQDGLLPYVMAHIAEHSIRPVPGGWTWKFDPRVFTRTSFAPEQLERLDCRAAFFRPEHGLVDAAMRDLIFDRLGRVAPVIEIPAAGHHVMIDQPLSLITGLRTLLADWEHSTPQD